MDIQKFQQKLTEVCELGEKNGKVLKPEQIKECFGELDLDKSQLIKILQYLKLKGISIEGAEEISAASQTDPEEVSEEKEEKVPLTAEEEAYLKEYLESRKDNDPALFVGSKKPNSRLTKTGIEDIIRRIGEKAGVENAHPHRFRRTALTNALNRGMPLQEAMIFAGHAKSETTMRYCTVNQEGVRYHHFKYLSA